MKSRPRTLFLGTPGPLAEGTLQGLLEAGARCVDAVLVPTPAPPRETGPLAIDRTDGLTATAETAGLALHRTGDARDGTLRHALVELGAERVLVACLGTRLSARTLASVPFGIFNVHPACLPHFRGPAPMFWQLRAGLRVGGVSVHRMDAGFDTGPLCFRRPVPLPVGISEPAAELEAGLRAGRALANGTGRFDAGTALTAPLGAYQGQPGPADFRLAPSWSVERVVRFVRGTRWRGVPFAIGGESTDRLVHDVLDTRPTADTIADRDADGDEAALRFSDGWLRVRWSAGP